MNRVRYSSKHRPLLYLFIFLFIWWISPVIFKSFTNRFFYEFQAPSRHASAYLDSIQSFWALKNHSKKELIETVKDLARLNNAYELGINQKNILKDEIGRLENILNLPPLPDYEYEIARISHREVNSWWQHFIIQKGANHGIQNGQGVVFSEGIVGRIKETFDNSAIVELITSPDFRIAAKFEDDGRPFTYEGLMNTPFSSPRGVAKHLAPDFIVQKGKKRKIISTGLGGVFPEGLTIGDVYQLTPGKDGLFQKGSVKLNPNLLQLKEVAVLVLVK